MSKKLTKRLIDNFVYEGKNENSWDIRWDTQIPSFGCRIYPSGRKSFIVWYKYKGRKRIHTLGQYGKITLDTARTLAIKHLAKIADDFDPTEQKRKAKGAYTVSQAFDQYLERYAKKQNKNWKEKERIFINDVIPVIGNLPVHEVTKANIIKIIDRFIKRGSPIAANRSLAYIKNFFKWCLSRDIIQISPADGIVKPSADVSRDRVLSMDEIKIIWKACEDIGYPYGVFVQFALITAQRRNEVITMKWKDIDFKNKVWHIPRENTKTNRGHDIPLSELALQILDNAKQSGKFVFTTTGKTPYSGFSKGKKSLDRRINKNINGDIDHWRIHDLRRTTASHLARLGTTPHVVEKILNHSSGVISGVAAIYNRYEYNEEKKEALNKWSELLVKK